MSQSSHPSGEVWCLQNTDNTKRACRERCRYHGNLKESEMPSRQSEGGGHRKPGVRADTWGVEEFGIGH